MQSDLFAQPTVAGLTLAPDIVDAAEESALIGFIDTLDLAPFRFQQWVGKRLTASFGLTYDFERGVLGDALPIPDELHAVRSRMASVAELEPAELSQALVIRYDAGAAIGWHRDRPQFERVIGLSLGAAATLRLRRRRSDGGFYRANVPLAPRSAYVLDREVRHDWEHSIAPIDKIRWSVTFRSLSAKGRKALG